MSKVKYTIHFDPEKHDRYKKIAKEKNYATFSGFIKDSLELVARKPGLLQYTEVNESAQILEKIKGSYDVFEQLSGVLNEINRKLSDLERFQEWTAKKLGASKKDLKKLREKDTSGEMIFDE
ncbi:MAG: hypothetical protein ACTSRU_19945 [Candidatus Hodarchaeales archaeon]